MEADVPVVESGGKEDFQYTLGGTTLVAHLTPGHTKGCTTWTMKLSANGKTLDAVIVGGVNVNPSYRLFNNPRYLTIAADYERTFRVLAALPCDLFLGAHGNYFDMEAKVARMKKGGANPFVDPDGYRKFVVVNEKDFRDEVARERAAAK